MFLVAYIVRLHGYTTTRLHVFVLVIEVVVLVIVCGGWKYCHWNFMVYEEFRCNIHMRYSLEGTLSLAMPCCSCCLYFCVNCFMCMLLLLPLSFHKHRHTQAHSNTLTYTCARLSGTTTLEADSNRLCKRSQLNLCLNVFVHSCPCREQHT